MLKVFLLLILLINTSCLLQYQVLKTFKDGKEALACKTFYGEGNTYCYTDGKYYLHAPDGVYFYDGMKFSTPSGYEEYIDGVQQVSLASNNHYVSRKTVNGRDVVFERNVVSSSFGSYIDGGMIPFYSTSITAASVYFKKK